MNHGGNEIRSEKNNTIVLTLAAIVVVIAVIAVVAINESRATSARPDDASMVVSANTEPATGTDASSEVHVKAGGTMSSPNGVTTLPAPVGHGSLPGSKSEAGEEKPSDTTTTTTPVTPDVTSGSPNGTTGTIPDSTSTAAPGTVPPTPSGVTQ